MTVWTRSRVAERLNEPLFDPLGDCMLENAGLGVHLVPRHAEHVGQEPLSQAVAPHDADGDFESLSRQLDISTDFVLDVAVVDELLEHARDRRRRDA